MTVEEWAPKYADIENEVMTTVKFKESLPIAANTIISAMQGEAGRLQFDAAKYIVEWVLGKPKDRDSAADNYERLLDAIADAGHGE